MTRQECRQIAMEIIKILKEEGYTITKSSNTLSDSDIKVSLSEEEIESLTGNNITERIQVKGGAIIQDILKQELLETMEKDLLEKIYQVKKNYRIEDSENVHEYMFQTAVLTHLLGMDELIYIPAIGNLLTKKYNDQDSNRIFAGIATILNEIHILYKVDRNELYKDYILIDILFDLMRCTTKEVFEITPIIMENIETWKNNMMLGVDLKIYRKESMSSNEFRFTMYRLFLKLVSDKEFIYPEFFKNKIESITI